ncbi:hypothetical protein Micbo1qcDRAFT_155056 [Microdochium bolleyi]|uniref:Uncharacterized protein n=1 Tax=Microdochium bolleyi TaxID=196109 RepID=A0A136JH69_9PEZI|nr:hypothetical protein Micbo1qcDRAFT_155056 [Microdochium bolleyi]
MKGFYCPLPLSGYPMKSKKKSSQNRNKDSEAPYPPWIMKVAMSSPLITLWLSQRAGCEESANGVLGEEEREPADMYSVLSLLSMHYFWCYWRMLPILSYNRKRPAAEKTMRPIKEASMACLSVGVPGEPSEKSDKADIAPAEVCAATVAGSTKPRMIFPTFMVFLILWCWCVGYGVFSSCDCVIV